MAIEGLDVASDREKAKSTVIHLRKILGPLGEKDAPVAVNLKELFEAVTKEIQPALQSTGDLVIKVSGSMEVTLEGSEKYLIFNTAAAGPASGTMKVTLTTTMEPLNK